MRDINERKAEVFVFHFSRYCSAGENISHRYLVIVDYPAADCRFWSNSMYDWNYVGSEQPPIMLISLRITSDSSRNAR